MILTNPDLNFLFSSLFRIFWMLTSISDSRYFRNPSFSSRKFYRLPILVSVNFIYDFYFPLNCDSYLIFSYFLLMKHQFEFGSFSPMKKFNSANSSLKIILLNFGASFK